MKRALLVILLAATLGVSGAPSARSSCPLVTSDIRPAKEVVRERLVIISQTDFTFFKRHFTSVDDLEEELEIRVKINPRLALFIVGGDQSHWGILVAVLDACRKAGVSDIKIEGAPENKNA